MAGLSGYEANNHCQDTALCGSRAVSVRDLTEGIWDKAAAQRRSYRQGNANEAKENVREKMIVIILLCAAVCAALGMGGLMMYGNARMAEVPGLSFREALEYTAHGKKDAVITVGTIVRSIGSTV